MLTSEQLRAARAALRMEQSTLAEKAGVSVETIKRLEAMNGELRAQYSTLNSIRQSLELEGIEFIDPDIDRGAGFQLTSDKNKRFRTEIAKSVSGWVDALLQVPLKDDPDFIVRDPASVAAYITENIGSFLEVALERIVGPRAWVPPAPPAPTRKRLKLKGEDAE